MTVKAAISYTVTKTAGDVSTIAEYLQFGEMTDSYGGGLYVNDGWSFSTVDHTVDGTRGEGDNCASMNGGGGWWYDYCAYSYLNSEKENRIGMTMGGVKVTNTIISVIRN
jgi:hypothetical protein